MARCFIIMPITTLEEFMPRFSGDVAHFEHVLDHLFKPAVAAAGFEPVSPVASGSDLIHAEIVRHLESSELVLCDISCVNPNVFFELGIRTAIDRPVALVRDHFTTNIPFDTSIVNFHTYDASLAPWILDTEIEKLTAHLKASSEGSQGRNPLWRYFGLTTRGVFQPEESPVEAKIDLIMHQLRDITERVQANSAEYLSLRPSAPRQPPLNYVQESAREILERMSHSDKSQKDILEGMSLTELHSMAEDLLIIGYKELSKERIISLLLTSLNRAAQNYR